MFTLIVITVLSVGYMIMSLHNGVPESLSATYYNLGEYGWKFQLTMFAIGILMLPIWMDLSDESYHCLCFLSCSSLLFVAAAPSFRLELEGKVHYSSAIVCCICVVLWQILEGVWDITLWFAFIGFMLSLSMKKNWCWWMEVAVIGSLLTNFWRLI